jgi:hypothetical protein
MLKLSAKCWISAFIAQGSRGITVAVQVGAVKIYVAAVEALRKKEKQGETQEFHSLLNANVLFCRIFKNLPRCMTKLGVLTLSLPRFTDISNV